MILYLKEFLSHYKFTPSACFLVKYLGHECNMDMPVPLPSCLWVVRLSCLNCHLGRFPLTRVVLMSHYQPLTLVGRWPLHVLFGLVLGNPGWPMVLCPLGPCQLGSPVEGLASLQWLWCALGATFPYCL